MTRASPRRTSTLRTVASDSRERPQRGDVGDRDAIDPHDHVAAPERRRRAVRVDVGHEDARRVRKAQRLGDLGGEILHGRTPELGDTPRRARGERQRRTALDQRAAHEDRAMRAQRERDRVARAAIDLDVAAAGLEHEAGEERLLLQRRDPHPPQHDARAVEDALHEVVGQRARRRQLLHLDRDRLRLGGTDPDRQQTPAGRRLQDHHRRGGRLVESDVPHLHLDLVALPPAARGERREAQQQGDRRRDAALSHGHGVV